MSTMVIGGVGVGDVLRSRATAPRSTQAHSQLVLTARGRRVLAFLALLLVAGVALLATRADASAPAGALAVETHVVASGETLWAIAESIAAPGEDVRDVVLELQRLNRLPSAGLMAGQSIVVPVTE